MAEASSLPVSGENSAQLKLRKSVILEQENFITKMRRRADSTKLSIFEYLAKFVGYCTLFIGFVHLVLAAYFYTLVMPWLGHGSPFWLLSLLFSLTLIFALWIWPSKCLIRGINECKSKKLLPWLASAMLQTILLGVVTSTLQTVHTGLIILWVALTIGQTLVWVTALTIRRRENEVTRLCNIEVCPGQNAILASTSNIGISSNNESASSDAPPSYDQAMREVTKSGTTLIVEGEEDLPPPYAF